MRRIYRTQEEYDAYAEQYREAALVRFGDWSFDTVRLVVRDGDREQQISHREGEVLSTLIDALPSPVEPRKLATECFISYEDVRVVIRRLRGRLGQGRIVTNAGGYEFVPFL